MRVALAAAAILALALVLPGPVHRYVFDGNRMEVVPGIYRSAQPSGREVADWTDELGLRSILNLRRHSGQWLEDETSAARERGLDHHSVGLSAKRMPPAPDVRRIIEVLDDAEKPLLLHCQAGVERSGLAAALAVLLAGGSVDDARDEFGLEKGYVQMLGLSDLPKVIDEYEDWLTQEGLETTPDALRRFADTAYAPYYYWVDIEAVLQPVVVAVGSRPMLHFRVTNLSQYTIPFEPVPVPGVRLGAHTRAADAGAAWDHELRGHGARLELAPGAATELTLSLPPIPRAGRFEVTVDLVDELEGKWFGAMGSPTLTVEIDSRRRRPDVPDQHAGQASP